MIACLQVKDELVRESIQASFPSQCIYDASQRGENSLNDLIKYASGLGPLKWLTALLVGI